MRHGTDEQVEGTLRAVVEPTGTCDMAKHRLHPAQTELQTTDSG